MVSNNLLAPRATFSRSASFTKNISSRFYSDNSLAKTTKAEILKQRRQARLEKQRAEQNARLELIQEEYEAEREKFERQRQRMMDRVDRKMKFFCARRIQRAWASYQYQCFVIYTENCAASILQNFIAHCAIKTRACKTRAALVIQRAWKAHVEYQLIYNAASFLQFHVKSFLQKVRLHRTYCATLIQRSFRQFVSYKQNAAACCVTRAIRLYYQKSLLATFTTVIHYCFDLQKREKAARSIQRALGIVVVRKHMVRYVGPDGMNFVLDRIIEEEETTKTTSTVVPRIRSARLKKALAEEKRVQKEKEALEIELKELEKQIESERTNALTEKEKLRRTNAIELHKDRDLDQELAEKNKETELQHRKNIRKNIQERNEIKRKQRKSIATLQKTNDDDVVMSLEDYNFELDHFLYTIEEEEFDTTPSVVSSKDLRSLIQNIQQQI